MCVDCIESGMEAAVWAWLRPKALERRLRQQGLKGNPYRLLYGDMKDMAMMSEEAKSKPCSGWSALDFSRRVQPFLHHTIHTYGKHSFTWTGRCHRSTYLNLS